VQGAVIELLADLRQSFGVSMLFITHDLGVVASIADRVIVLDRGRIVEQGPIDEAFHHPRTSAAGAAARGAASDRSGLTVHPGAHSGRR
jgi:ABC-type dipeptide/oligopeptide/nickel transport system ATPase component